jgi:hypothetical protein
MQPSFDSNHFGVTRRQLSAITDLCSEEIQGSGARDKVKAFPFIEVLADILKFLPAGKAPAKVALLKNCAKKLQLLADRPEALSCMRDLLRAVHHSAARLPLRRVEALLTMAVDNREHTDFLRQFSDTLLSLGSVQATRRIDIAVDGWSQISELSAALDEGSLADAHQLFRERLASGAVVSGFDLIKVLVHSPVAHSILSGYASVRAGSRLEFDVALSLARSIESVAAGCARWSKPNEVLPTGGLEESLKQVAIARSSELLRALQVLELATSLPNTSESLIKECCSLLLESWPVPSVRVAVQMYAEEGVQLRQNSKSVGCLARELRNVLQALSKEQLAEIGATRNQFVIALAAVQGAVQEAVQQGLNDDSTVAVSKALEICAHTFSLMIAERSLRLESVKHVEVLARCGVFVKSGSHTRTTLSQYMRSLTGAEASEQLRRSPELGALVLSGGFDLLDTPAWRGLQELMDAEDAWKPESWPNVVRWLRSWKACTARQRTALPGAFALMLKRGEVFSRIPVEKFAPATILQALAPEFERSLELFLRACRLFHCVSVSPETSEKQAAKKAMMLQAVVALSDSDRWPRVKEVLRDYLREYSRDDASWLTQMFFTFVFDEMIIDDTHAHTDPVGWLMRASIEQLGESLADSTSNSPMQYLATVYERSTRGETLIQRDTICGYIDGGARLTDHLRSSFRAYSLDSLPFLWRGADRQSMLGEVVEIYRRGYERVRGFGAMTLETKRPLDGSDSLALQFARLFCTDGAVLNCDNRDSMPGPGILYSGIQLERLLVKSDRYPKEPYADYKLAWSFLAEELDDLPKAQILYSRGLMAVIPPSTEKYALHGCHYSLVMYSNHFPTQAPWSFYLVPSSILSEALRGRSVPVREYSGAFVAGYASSSAAPLDFFSLRMAAARKGLSILSLGWMSNVAGLCNAFPPGSAPYHLWEVQRNERTRNEILRGDRRRPQPALSSDRAGHVHKAYAYSREDSTQILSALRTAHQEVYQIASQLFNLHDAFRLVRSLWHKGWHVSESGEAGSVSKFMGVRSPMLRQAYAFYRDRFKGAHEASRHYRLVVAEALDYSVKPRSPVVLSIDDLSLTTSTGKRVVLPLDGEDTFEEVNGIWDEYVAPHIQESSKDLRFYVGSESLQFLDNLK